MRVPGAAFVVLLLALALPDAIAQNPPAGHVPYCSKECAPSQVNDGDARNSPTNVILYAHIADTLQRAPLNAMPPDLAKEPDVNGGFVTPTIKVRDDLLYFDHNWFHMYHLPNFVTYGAEASNHDGPLAYPMKLVGDFAKAYWYLSPHAVPQANSTQLPAGGVGVLPQVTVYGRLETGRHANHGELIAEGQTSTPVVVALPGGDYAYEFEIPLKIVNGTIAPEKGFVFSVNWYQVRAGEEEFIQSDWRIRSGIRFPARVILPIDEPIRLLDSLAIFRDGTHYIVTEMAPVLGAYDVYPFSLNLTFFDGPTRVQDPQPVLFLVDRLTPMSVRIIWAVPRSADALKAGTYSFGLSASNLQQTYRLSENITIDILGFSAAKEHGSEGVAANVATQAVAVATGAALVAVAGVAGAFLRRRP